MYNEASDAKGLAEIIIGKQRNGPIGKVILTFLGKYTRFENHARDEELLSLVDVWRIKKFSGAVEGAF